MPPPYRHSYGISKATPKHLFMFFGPRTFFDDPQGLATAKMESRDDTTTEADDDEVVVYGVNSGRHQIIYNTSMWGLALYGKKGSGKDEFLYPKGVACDTKGNVYVVDSGNNRVVQLFNPKKNVQWVRAFDGNGEGSPPLNAPSHVSLDETGKVYITDTGNRRIVVCTGNGEFLRQIPSKTGEGPTFENGPVGIAVADGRNPWSHYDSERVVFCLDRGGRRIRKITFSGQKLAEVMLPKGRQGLYAATDYYHNVWITDKDNHCILKYDHNLNFLDEYGSYGKDQKEFVQPRGIAIWKRYGQTFVAEEKGAQYFWMGTDIGDYSLRNLGENRYRLTVDLKAFSFVHLLKPSSGDTTRFVRKRRVGSGKNHIDFTSKDNPAGSLILRIEPTYSSYTYISWDYPISLKK